MSHFSSRGWLKQNQDDLPAPSDYIGEILRGMSSFQNRH